MLRFKSVQRSQRTHHRAARHTAYSMGAQSLRSKARSWGLESRKQCCWGQVRDRRIAEVTLVACHHRIETSDHRTGQLDIVLKIIAGECGSLLNRYAINRADIECR